MKYFGGAAAFIKVINCGSFSGAAAALGLSTAAISKSVKNLENEVGVRLLNRSTRQLSLTDEGRIFFERCNMALLDLESAANAVKECRRGPTGVLRVTSTIMFGRCHILPLLAEFAECCPNVIVDLTLDDSFVDMVRECYEVGIRADLPPAGNLVAKQIAPVQAIVCGSPSYFEHFSMPNTPEDLLHHNCIRFRSLGNNRILKWEFQKDGETVLRDVRGNLILSDMEGICHAAIDGRGLAQLPGFLAIPFFETGQLRPVMLDYLSQSRAIYVCYPPFKHMPLRIRTFVNFLVEGLRQKVLQI